MDEAQDCKCDPGLPAWLATFADLMSLLMCFFVLLLAFSEMDVLKFKQIAGSMNFAFGVQNKIEVKDIPKGTSMIAREFSPGKPEPSVIESVMQHTMEITETTLEIPKGGDTEGEESADDQGIADKDLQAEVENMKKILGKELKNGEIEIEALSNMIILRIRERGLFPSGNEMIHSTFKPTLDKISKLLNESKARDQIRVEGHSDNIPIQTARFRSNWDLSAARAVSVAHELMRNKNLEPERFVVSGYADTKALVPNDSAKNRARNRRVEIQIVKGKPHKGDRLRADPEGPPQLLALPNDLLEE